MGFFTAALEAHDEGAEIEEIEYSQFLKLNKEQLDEVGNTFLNCEKLLFSESKIPTTGEPKTRLRHYHEAEDGEAYELTTKVPTDIPRCKLEHNQFICKDIYASLNTLASSIVMRRRIFIPILNSAGEPTIRRSGTPLLWELDLYFTVDNGSLQICEWVKLELEVDKATVDNVVSIIPFRYDDIIQSDSQDANDRALISNLYDDVYNLKNKSYNQ